MREIKFEYGFESINGIVKKVYHLSEIPNIQQMCDVWNVLPIKYVREWTGLKDKNGTEIYEGDKNQDGGVVIWNKDDASFSWEYIDEIMAMQEESEWCEVIGNIHQNPELL